MISFLRLIGILNAAIWLGGSVFYTVVASPAVKSVEMAAVLDPKNAPYFSPAIDHVVLSSYFQFSIACALIALLHLCLEWLYLGRPSRKFSFSLLAGLLLYSLIGSNLVQPRLEVAHKVRYTANAQPASRQLAVKSFKTWRVIFNVTNTLAIGGLFVFFWRLTNPPATPRFVSSVKFRG